MTNHPRGRMKVETLHDTLVSGNRVWSWVDKVTCDGRTFLVTRSSRVGAFGVIDEPGYEHGRTRQIVESYIAGTLKNHTVIEQIV